MAAMKPRTGDGPLEAERDLHGTTLRMPLEGGGRLVLELSDEEVESLHEVLGKVLEL
ncbi:MULTISPECIES: DUF3117 domain-containing protein [Trueperella]|uniref:DUF3117 domain-containing protein n=1 Tax=Trueperella abortisuis TaxID=445930 RepID=A0ABT9PH33_9ACTO|nr:MULTISPECIES: DUF3117 domain-containing protein [Trueperella]MCI7306610.1 DUF3117 domain-containing protein [Trueperella sp.]MDP9832033.1 hypothetical protein [Trueperella abortisuis]MDY5403800.1 DUF3117 domain-containing protein [Trueperella sp.]